VPRKARILVVDDDAKTVASVRLYLEHAGYAVDVAGDGRMALERARADPPPDLVVLDRMLPHLDGLAVCRLIRGESGIPVILLTARTSEADRLEGLDLGADDYVSKPFSPRELVARVRAVLRRTQEDTDEIVTAGALTVDVGRRVVEIAGRAVDLTPREFAILMTLAKAPGRVLSREALRDRAFGAGSEALDRTVDAHIVKLRRKLAAAATDPARAPRVETVFGVGYRLAAPPGDDA
jgi:DNA-binding response OmpR family regulator